MENDLTILTQLQSSLLSLKYTFPSSTWYFPNYY